MSDLDVERRERQQAREAALGDRSFTFGGEKFTHVRDCPWDVIERASALETTSASGMNVLSSMRTLVTELIEPGDEIERPDESKGYANHERFNDLLRRKEDPITVDDVSALLRWLMGAASGRPTVSSPPSQDGSEASGTASTETSLPEQVAVSKS